MTYAPRVVPYEAQTIRTKENAPFVDAENIVGILSQISDCDAPKVLVAAPSTKVIWAMFAESDLLQQLNDMGYTIMHITSKHGAYIDKKKVSRKEFSARDVINFLAVELPQRPLIPVRIGNVNRAV